MLSKITYIHIYVLPTSRLGYHAGKPIESVVYCLIITYFMLYNITKHVLYNITYVIYVI